MLIDTDLSQWSFSSSVILSVFVSQKIGLFHLGYQIHGHRVHDISILLSMSTGSVETSPLSLLMLVTCVLPLCFLVSLTTGLSILWIFLERLAFGFQFFSLLIFGFQFK